MNFKHKHNISHKVLTLQVIIKDALISNLPSNIEVTLEIEKIAEENEGAKRDERLTIMRQEAL
jgi:hypothetical protein